MYCKYCEETSKDNIYTSGCKNFRISDIQKHLRSHDHSASTETYLMPYEEVGSYCDSCSAEVGHC